MSDSAFDAPHQRTPRRTRRTDIDTERPGLARTHNMLLGGKDNFAVDRAAAEVILEHMPQARLCAQENRAALTKAVRYLAGTAGIDQFLDLGCGFPTVENTHELAQRINPHARVCYVDNDPMVLAHGRALLAVNENTTVVDGDLFHPHELLDDPQVKSFLDLNRPVALLICGLLMHCPDHRRPNDRIRVLVDGLATGSHLFVTSWPDTGEPAQRALAAGYQRALGNGWLRSEELFAEHWVGLELVPPGLRFTEQWFPDEPDRPIPSPDELEPHQRIQMAGIGRKI